MARKSLYSTLKKKSLEFIPDIEDWKKACEFSAFDVQIIKYFGICKETFYAFLDKERFKQEQDSNFSSAYLDAYVKLRKKTKNKISKAFMDKIDSNDTGSIIFGMKAYNGVIEQKDIEHIEIKKRQVALKTNEFLTSLAEKFKLDKNEIKVFADKYFKDMDLDNV